MTDDRNSMGHQAQPSDAARRVARATLQIALIGMFFIVFAVALTWVYQTEALWRVLRERIGNLPSYMAAADLSIIVPTSTERGVALIGDFQFIAEARKFLAPEIKGVYCRVDHMDAKDVVNCLRLLNKVGWPHEAVAQFSPYFLSNLATGGNAPEHWVLHRGEREWFSLRAVRRSFDLLSLWAKAPGVRPEMAPRPQPNELVSFNCGVAGAEQFDDLRQEWKTRILWVIDTRGVDYRLAPKFYDRYRAEKGSIESCLPFGRLLDFEDLTRLTGALPTKAGARSP